MAITKEHHHKSKFEVDIEKLHYKNQILAVKVSKTSSTEIYSVSFSYIIIDKYGAEDNLQFYDNTLSAAFSDAGVHEWS